MAKRKKRWKQRGRPKARHSAAMPAGMRLTPRRGRPAQREDGPTPQTVANLRPDVLLTLAQRKLVSADEAIAGREILDAWELITAPVGVGHADLLRIAGRNDVDGARAERLQRIWRLWAAEMPARTSVRCFVVVEWIKGDRRCDMQPSGDAGVLRKALDWWLKSEPASRRSASTPPPMAA